jgi:lipoate-protein ligase A
VLGSSQPWSDVDAARAAGIGLDVARRRSGGGAVLVGPGQVLWVDLVIPAGDPRWDADVGRAAWWVGDQWAAALNAVGIGDASVWRGALQRGPWSDRVCFAGLGPGEVTVRGAKVVGLSQRRTRGGALFQGAALLRWDPAELVGVLALSESERERAVAELGSVARGVGREVESGLLEAFLGGLARA